MDEVNSLFNKMPENTVNQQIADKDLFSQLTAAYSDWQQFHRLLQQIELPAPQAQRIFKQFQQRIDLPVKIPPYTATALPETNNKYEYFRSPDFNVLKIQEIK